MAKKHWFSPRGDLAAVLVFAAFVRLGTFFLGHAGGDQTFYVALAMKLDAIGLKGYTLREVGIRPDPQGRFADLAYEKDPLFPLVELQKKEGGLSFYDVPLFYTPPLYAEVLRVSHAVFRANDTYRLIIKVPSRLASFHADELYAVMPSFLFSLGAIFLTAVIGWRYFGGPAVGVTAAALLSVSPVDLLAAARVWPDSMAVFFVTLAFLLYLEMYAKDSKLLAVAGGAMLALAILSKGTSLFFIPSIIIACVLSAQRQGNALEAHRKLLDTSFFLYLSVAFALTLPWHAAMSALYGNPFYSGPFPKANGGLDSQWYGYVRGRSWLVYPVDTFFQNPAFLFWLMPLRRLVTKKYVSETEILAFIFPVILAAGLLVVWPGREERYLLSAYPALALTAAAALVRLRRALNTRGGRAGTLLLLAVVGLSALWSLGLAYMHLFMFQSDMIPVPF